MEARGKHFHDVTTKIVKLTNMIVMTIPFIFVWYICYADLLWVSFSIYGHLIVIGLYALLYFEIGKVYNYNNGSYHEKEHLAIAMSGSFTSTLWKGTNETVDFYLLKGIINSKFLPLVIEFTYLPIYK